MPYTGLSFAVLNITYKKLIDGYQITVTTDVPSHLWLRWTNHEPQIHDKPVLKRGIKFNTDRRFCFVVYEDNEQVEPGDTTTHTFLKHNWPSCETRYFYFLGTIAGNPSPSTTAIFSKHFHILKATIIGTISNRTLYQDWIDWDDSHDDPTGKEAGGYNPPLCRLYAGSYQTVSHTIYRGFLFFNLSQIPTGSTIVAANLDLFILQKGAGVPAYPYLYITKGVQHDPIVLADYGTQLPETTVRGQIKLVDIILNQYNSIPFNNAGLSLLTPGAITKLCLRSQLDVIDYAMLPVYYSHIVYHSAQKGVSYQPKLSVWYQ